MLKKTFAVGATVFAILLGVIVAGGAFAVSQIRIGGPAYESIIRDKDLIADVLPPPAYVIEANLEVAEIMLHPEQLEVRRQRLAELRRQYTERIDFWAGSALPASLRTTLAEKVDAPGQKFWTAVETEVLPAVERGDTAAAISAHARAESFYAEHRRGVDTAVTEATALQAADQKSSEGVGAWATAGLAAGTLALICGLGFAAYLIIRRVFSPLGWMTLAMEQLATGNTDIRISGVDRKDEIGAMARALTVFRGNALELAAAMKATHDVSGIMKAAKNNQAVIDFDPSGNILDANDNFLKAMGYSLSDIVGRHHRMFVDKAYAASPEYTEFWRKLGTGEFIGGTFNRMNSRGETIILNATYSVLLDEQGKPYKVVKFATDITAAENLRIETAERQAAITAEQAEIVNETAAGLSALAAGDLAHRITMAFPGDYARLKTDFNAAMDTLEEAMGVIGTNASAIQSGAGEISQAADDLSRRTEQQAATLEETAAALDEITATVKRTAEGAERAGTVVVGAKAAAEQSGIVVGRAVAAMGEIERSSDQISQIIGVIDEIAFQTNLLALNAGVEAARAGDAGRGFAVVASEVRALAQRSAEAAKEIKTLIAASSGHVKDGVGLVGETGQALTAIVERVAEINGLMAEITASAHEQATALSQVNTAVNQMDQTTQQNAAMVEQSTAASHNLSQEAEELAVLVGKFHVSEDGRAPARAARARPNPVHAAQARIEAEARPSARRTAAVQTYQPAPRSVGSTALKADQWEEFLTMAGVPTEATAMLELISFEIGGQEFCLDVRSVREIRGWTATTPTPQTPDYVLGVINLRGAVIPVLDLRCRLGLGRTEPSSRHVIVVIQHDSRMAGVLVDAVQETFQLAASLLQAPPAMNSNADSPFIDAIIPLESRMLSRLVVGSLFPQKTHAEAA